MTLHCCMLMAIIEPHYTGAAHTRLTASSSSDAFVIESDMMKHSHRLPHDTIPNSSDFRSLVVVSSNVNSNTKPSSRSPPLRLMSHRITSRRVVWHGMAGDRRLSSIVPCRNDEKSAVAEGKGTLINSFTSNKDTGVKGILHRKAVLPNSCAQYYRPKRETVKEKNGCTTMQLWANSNIASRVTGWSGWKWVKP